MSITAVGTNVSYKTTKESMGRVLGSCYMSDNLSETPAPGLQDDNSLKQGKSGRTPPPGLQDNNSLKQGTTEIGCHTAHPVLSW